MKEKDIVDFEACDKNEAGEYIDKDGCEIGCEVCYTHEKAYEKLSEILQTDTSVHMAMCPKCNSVCYIDEYHTVSEENCPVPDGEIGLYQTFFCDNCDQSYALMPIPVVYNGNHGIHYTGGKNYITDDDIRELPEMIHGKITNDIRQYLHRKIDEGDSSLGDWNIKTWNGYSIEHAVAEWLYNRGMKK